MCCRFEDNCIQNNNNEAGFLTALIFSIVTEQTIGEPCCSVPQLHCSECMALFGPGRSMVSHTWLTALWPVTQLQQAVKSVPGLNCARCTRHPTLGVGLPLQPAGPPSGLICCYGMEPHAATT